MFQVVRSQILVLDYLSVVGCQRVQGQAVSRSGHDQALHEIQWGKKLSSYITTPCLHFFVAPREDTTLISN